MTRTLRTLLLSATALGALATAASAAPGMSPKNNDTTGTMHPSMMAQYGNDVDAMQTDCPVLAGDSMATMHENGGHELEAHHRAMGVDR
jgi:hypothetical protein